MHPRRPVGLFREADCHPHDDHDHGAQGHDNLINTGNMNIDAAFLHVLGDLLMSVGVIIAAFFIWLNPNLWWFDPLCTYLFSVIVMFTTIPIVKNCIQILMEGTPPGINLEKLTNDIINLDRENIVDVHDIHVWQIAAGKNTMSGHIKSRKPLKRARAMPIQRQRLPIWSSSLLSTSAICFCCTMPNGTIGGN